MHGHFMLCMLNHKRALKKLVSQNSCPNAQCPTRVLFLFFPHTPHNVATFEL